MNVKRISWLAISLLAIGLIMTTACQDGADSTSEMASVEVDRFSELAEAEPAAQEAMADGAEGERSGADSSDGSQSSDSSDSSYRKLIYTGRIVLAIFDVTQTQEKAIDLVEELGGYVSNRSSDHLVLRVPAGDFRPVLDQIAELGDVLELNWSAEDVSEVVRDVEIRLRNARELRDRLELLLERADTVEDALKIEAELERITLDIERLHGQLESLEDRIAYSTIEVHFDPQKIQDLPDDDFLLPVAWVDDVGIESLLNAPEVWR